MPLGLPAPDPILQGHLTERLTELGVILALMTAGLKIDRAPGLRRWESAWRLLGITMPLTIALSALVGWWLAGLAVLVSVTLGGITATPVVEAWLGEEEPTVEPPGATG